MDEPRYQGKTVIEWIDAVRDGAAIAPVAFKALRDGRVGPRAKAAVPLLIEALDDYTEGIPFNVRYVAAFALGRIGVSAKAAIPALLRRVQDDDRTTVLEATNALLRIGPKQCGVSFWKQLLTHQDDYVARIAAQALRKIGPGASDAVEALFGALSSHVACGLPQIYSEAIPALVTIVPDDPRLIDELKRGIGMSNYGFQKTAIEGLVKIGSEEAFDVLRHLPDHMHTAPPTPPLERLIDKLQTTIPGLAVQPRTTASCPHCGKELRTTKARQCFECGADWH